MRYATDHHENANIPSKISVVKLIPTSTRNNANQYPSLLQVIV